MPLKDRSPERSLFESRLPRIRNAKPLCPGILVRSLPRQCPRGSCNSGSRSVKVCAATVGVVGLALLAWGLGESYVRKTPMPIDLKAIRAESPEYRWLDLRRSLLRGYRPGSTAPGEETSLVGTPSLYSSDAVERLLSHAQPYTLPALEWRSGLRARRAVPGLDGRSAAREQTCVSTPTPALAQTSPPPPGTGTGWQRLSTGAGAYGWYFSAAVVERGGAGRIWHTWKA